MNPTRKRFVSLFLIFSLVMLSGNLLAKDWRGATLIITKKDYKQIRGELITVKPNSLLLLDIGGRDVSVDISEIKVIKIVKKSKLLLGAGLGLLIGATYVLTTSDPLEELYNSTFGILFAIIGGIVGLASGEHKIIQIEGRHPSSIEFTLKELRKKARIPDYK